MSRRRRPERGLWTTSTATNDSHCTRVLLDKVHYPPLRYEAVAVDEHSFEDQYDQHRVEAQAPNWENPVRWMSEDDSGFGEMRPDLRADH